MVSCAPDLEQDSEPGWAELLVLCVRSCVRVPQKGQVLQAWCHCASCGRLAEEARVGALLGQGITAVTEGASLGCVVVGFSPQPIRERRLGSVWLRCSCPQVLAQGAV